MSRVDRRLAAVIQRALEAIRSGAAMQSSSLLAMIAAGTLGASIGQIQAFQSGRVFWLGVLTALLGTCVTALLLIAAFALVRSIGVTNSVSIPLILFSAAGAIRLVLLALLHEAVAIPSLYSWAIRPFTGALQGIIWLGAASLYYANRDRFVEARDSVLEERALVIERARQQSALSDAMTRELADTVEQAINRSVSESRELISGALNLEASETALRRIAASMRHAIDEEIRPISRRLWSESPAERVRMSPAQLFRIGCYARPYPLASPVIVAILFVLPTTVSLPKPWWATSLLFAQLVIVVVVLAALNRWWRKGNASAFRYWFGASLASLLVGLPAWLMQSAGWSFEETRYWAIYTTSSALVLIVFLSVIQGLAGTRDSLVERAYASLTHADIERRANARRLTESSRKLARHLHSSLQGRLMAITLELERATSEGSSDAAELALRRLDTLLATPLVGAFDDEPSVDVVQALTKLAEEWSAIAVVDLHLNVQTPNDMLRGALVVGIAEEAIANAVRHAGATHVSFELQQDARDAYVRVTNNGSASARGDAGLGSRWLDSVSPSSWRLTPDASGGMLLEVRLKDLFPEGAAQ